MTLLFPKRIVFFGDFLSASLDVESDWNFRILDKRLVVVKTKSETIHKVAVLDVSTNVMFTVEVPETVRNTNLAVNCRKRVPLQPQSVNLKINSMRSKMSWVSLKHLTSTKPWRTSLKPTGFTLQKCGFNS